MEVVLRCENYVDNVQAVVDFTMLYVVTRRLLQPANGRRFLLWVMSTEISVDIAVDIAVDTRSTVGRYSVDTRSIVGRQSVDTRSTLGRQSVDIAVDSRSIVGR